MDDVPPGWEVCAVDPYVLPLGNSSPGVLVSLPYISMAGMYTVEVKTELPRTMLNASNC